MPDAHVAMRGNGVADAIGDAKYPIAGAKLLSASNQKMLDLQSTTVQRAPNGDVVVTVKVPGLSPSQNGLLPASIDDSGTPIQQARYVTRWDFGGQAYYAEMTLTGQEGGVSYGSGTVGTAEGQYNAGNVTATLGNTYQPLSGATGTFRSGSYVIRVPAAAVGSPSKGSRFYSVGTYAVLGPTDLPYGSVQELPVTVDSTPTFDTAFGVTSGSVSGSAPTHGLPPAIGGGKSGGKSGGSLASTGRPVGVAVLALALLATAGVVVRRRS
jgi:hypothetical protein